ncbi:MAG: hypothetical protein O3B24_11890 [Verrucomicrobia bacterium]|nr:hypothetical protein [Verrucomicrobiota bacterium]
MQRVATILAGFALVALGLLGVVHGLRAGIAHSLDFACRYGVWVGQPDRILAAAERAHRVYPHNYLICIVAGESAYYDRYDAGGQVRADRLAAAAAWCARGLVLNPLASQLRMLDMRLTEPHALSSAIRKWEAYVDWECWEPHNHVVLVELYSKAGRYPEALESLALLEPDPASHARARRHIEQAWRGEMDAMQALQHAATP